MASGNFENCLPIILRFEGGRSNDPADPGGRTNKGITQRTYDAYRGAKGEPHADVYSIADAEVADCYRKNYWDAVNGDSLRPGEDLVVFDFAVNSGPAHALHVWKALTAGGGLTELSATIEAVCSNRLAFMRSLSTWPHFGPGWARRVAQVQQYGLAMADGKAPAAKVKVKAGHAGGAVIVAGGAAAAGAHWFGSPWIWVVAITGAAIFAAISVWGSMMKSAQMTAAKAHLPATPPSIPAPSQAPPAPMAPDDLDAAMAKVSAAKGALAQAVAEALQARDALVARVAAMQAATAAAESKLAAMGVDIAPLAAANKVVHLQADDLVAAAPLIGEPATHG